MRQHLQILASIYRSRFMYVPMHVQYVKNPQDNIVLIGIISYKIGVVTCSISVIQSPSIVPNMVTSDRPKLFLFVVIHRMLFTLAVRSAT